jgi:hypothetical protein
MPAIPAWIFAVHRYEVGRLEERAAAPSSLLFVAVSQRE